jgi:c-di-GMP-binding flagellar brake protein YcgR
MDEVIFEVGQALSVESHFRTYVTTHVLGWDAGAFLLTRAIRGRSKEPQLKSRDVCKVRFLREGVAYGFEAVVLSVQFLPAPIMFLRYPEHVERVELRRAPRCKVGMPVKLSDQAGAESPGAVMDDLSEGGCLLRVPVQPDRALSVDAVYTVSFVIVEKTFSITCKVRKLDRRGEEWSIGLAFTDLPEADRDALSRLIKLMRSNAGA